MLDDRHSRGSASEQMVSSYLALLGYEVFSPSVTHCRADLVYVSETRAVRVQVKTATWAKSGVFKYEQCRLQKKNNDQTYTPEEVDEVWIVGTHLWRFPITMIEGWTSVYLNTDNPSPQPRRRTYDPNDFIVVRGSLAFPYRDRLTSNDPTPLPDLSARDFLTPSPSRGSRPSAWKKLHDKFGNKESLNEHA